MHSIAPVHISDDNTSDVNNDQTTGASGVQATCSIMVRSCIVSVCDIGSQVNKDGSLIISKTGLCLNIYLQGAGLRRSSRLKMKAKKQETCNRSSVNVPYDNKLVLNKIRGILAADKLSNDLQFI